MSTESPADFEAVLEFWFGKLDSEGTVDEQVAARWWKKDSAFDQEIRERFGALHDALATAKRSPATDSAREILASIVVLDQFSRNMFRGTPKMFAFDAKARELALHAIERGMDQTVAYSERGFIYTPLTHAEDLALQERAIALYTTRRDSLSGAPRERAERSLKPAQMHYDIVKRFGRFPHRNELLGRPSTPEEIAFLKEPGSSFL